MKRLLTSIILFTVVFCHISAQGNKTFSPKEFLQQQEKFITDEAQISQNEATKFFPMFHEMNDQLRKKEKRVRDLMREVRTKQLTEAQCKSILQEVDSLALEKVKIENNYHKKFLTVLSVEKVLKVLEANRRFDRQLLKRMINREHQPHTNQRKK